SGGGFYLRDLSAVIDGDLLDWELPELPDVRWPADEDSGSEPEEPHQAARLGGVSFTDLAVPLAGLDVEVIRTYDSRDKRHGDFGVGWTLDARQGTYRNNRPPGDGWQFQSGFLPCDTVAESKSHLTTIRLSDQEVHRFALSLSDGASTMGGCFAQASFAYVDGPLPGSTLEILGGTEVFFANGSDRVVDPSTQETYVPQDVRLTTRDGRIFHLNLISRVTHIEDLNGNTLEITPAGITHSSGRGVELVRDAEGRIERIIDPLGDENVYTYDEAGDLVTMTDRAGATTRFTYEADHYLADLVNALGVRALRTEYDADGRIIRSIDAAGKEVAFEHDVEGRREVVTNRLGFSRVLEYDGRGNVVRETAENGKVTNRTFDARENLLSERDPLGRTTVYEYSVSNDLPMPGTGRPRIKESYLNGEHVWGGIRFAPQASEFSVPFFGGCSCYRHSTKLKDV
ncbi:MAG: RHS repeat protein, partial [bacterium]|nr:RHS repeat protein [bacterium]